MKTIKSIHRFNDIRMEILDELLFKEFDEPPNDLEILQETVLEIIENE